MWNNCTSLIQFHDHEIEIKVKGKVSMESSKICIKEKRSPNDVTVAECPPGVLNTKSMDSHPTNRTYTYDPTTAPWMG